MNTDSAIWKALHAMATESKSSTTDVLVARALNELDSKDAEIARLRALMARAASLAEKLQPDTLAGVVVSLLTAGGQEVEKGVDVIRALCDVLESERGERHSPHYATGEPVAYCKVGRCGVINKVLRLAGRL